MGQTAALTSRTPLLTDCRNTTALARCERSKRQSSRIPTKRSVSTRNVSSAYVQNSQAVRQYKTARAPATPQTDLAPRHRTIIFKWFGIKLRRKHAAQLAVLPLPSAPLTARVRTHFAVLLGNNSNLCLPFRIRRSRWMLKITNCPAWI